MCWIFCVFAACLFCYSIVYCFMLQYFHYYIGFYILSLVYICLPSWSLHYLQKNILRHFHNFCSPRLLCTVVSATAINCFEINTCAQNDLLCIDRTKNRAYTHTCSIRGYSKNSKCREDAVIEIRCSSSSRRECSVTWRRAHDA